MTKRKGYTLVELVFGIAFVILVTLASIPQLAIVGTSTKEFAIRLQEVSAVQSIGSSFGNVFNFSTRNQPGTRSISDKLTSLTVKRSDNRYARLDFQNLQINGSTVFAIDKSALTNIPNLTTPILVYYYTIDGQLIGSSNGLSGDNIPGVTDNYANIFRINYFIGYRGKVIPFGFKKIINPNYTAPTLVQGYQNLFNEPMDILKTEGSTTFRNDFQTSSNVINITSYSSYWGVQAKPPLNVSAIPSNGFVKVIVKDTNNNPVPNLTVFLYPPNSNNLPSPYTPSTPYYSTGTDGTVTTSVLYQSGVVIYVAGGSNYAGRFYTIP